MAWQLETIHDGQLPVSKTTLFTATVPTLVGEIVLVNTDGSARMCNVYVNRTGTSRRIMAKDLSVAAGGEVRRAMATTLLAGDTIEGDASAATVVDIVISGAKDA